MELREKLVKEINQIRDYFGHHATKNPSFMPEYKVASAINSIINASDRLTEEHAEQIVSIFNSISNTEHYNGSGWADFEMHLFAIMRLDGINR